MSDATRTIPDRLDTRASRVLKSWEALLLALAVAIFIANCLSSLDTRITAETQQLAALKTHKQGLMQQLFPVAESVAA